jgi:Pyridoxamine 5'-phosphate oxidase
MTSTLPPDVRDAFESFVTCELTTVDATKQPITWPVTPYYRLGGPEIDITTGLGYPKKAEDARRNHRVSLLFSDPTGSRLDRPPAVLVQGTAKVDDEDLAANRARYYRESQEKLPAVKSMMPPKLVQRFLDWYLTRIYVHVRPERIYVWSGGDFGREPRLYGSHIEEVRSGHFEEPVVDTASPEGGPPVWDDRMGELGRRYRTAVVSVVAPDGFPLSARVPIELDESRRRIRLEQAPVGVPLARGLACVTAHEHDPDFKWQVNFQVRGDLVPEGGTWVVVPRRLIGGFELPPGGLERWTGNARKIMRFRKAARRQKRRRG